MAAELRGAAKEGAGAGPEVRCNSPDLDAGFRHESSIRHPSIRQRMDELHAAFSHRETRFPESLEKLLQAGVVGNWNPA
jgi:hypothetical protein